MNRTELTGAFARFLDGMDAIVTDARSEAETLDRAEAHLQALIATDAWLPGQFKQHDPIKYQQLALYVDPQARYSVVSFVWGPGQSTPVHNHTVWGLVGVLDGAETCEEYSRSADASLVKNHAHALERGAIDRVSPTIGDVHKVSNAFADRASVSIHVYGGDIGRIERNVFDANGSARPFVSGYSNATPWITQ
jgi:3-mercaptopropionate dioxygenase